MDKVKIQKTTKNHLRPERESTKVKIQKIQKNQDQRPEDFIPKKEAKKIKNYITIASKSTFETTIKRSRFIGTAAPISSENEAAEFISAVKNQHRDARHNVFAYLLRSGIKKYSDDGEPQGTGGVPALQVLEKSGITDCAVVVTRYFGGILLGAGGLVRAYSAAASGAIASAEKAHMAECARCSISCEYALHGKIAALSAEFGEIIDTKYTDNVNLELYISLENMGKFDKILSEISSGSVKLVEIEKVFRKTS